jgi:hypothetical protein
MQESSNMFGGTPLERQRELFFDYPYPCLHLPQNIFHHGSNVTDRVAR